MFLPLRRVLRRLLVASCAAYVLAAGWRASARDLSVVDLLDRYAAGQFEAVVAELNGEVKYSDLLKQLKGDGAKWIEAGGPAAREKRRLVAATFALEAARADEWFEWKWTQKQDKMCPPPPPPGGAPSNAGCYQPLNVLYWQAPPLLLEWACELMRKDPSPAPIERWWQLAALAVAQRSEDAQFLVGDTAIGRGVAAGEIINSQDEITHLKHVRERFPNEARFMLAEGIARDRYWTDDAMQAYGSLVDDPDVAGEAMMRMGAMVFRQNRFADALKHFDLAESKTRDRYVIYLSKYFRGRIAEAQKRQPQAESAYRVAVTAWPHGQAATLALASLLFQDGRRAEAQELSGAMFATDPMPTDPWREFIHADDRFWPQLVGKLRAEILHGAPGLQPRGPK